MKNNSRKAFGLLLLLSISILQILAQHSIVGEWSNPTQTPDVFVHANVLPNGKVMVWSANYSKEPRQNSMTFVWDPNGNSFTESFNSTTNLFCSGHSYLPDGRLFVTGGHYAFLNDDYVGEKHTNIYDYRNNTWTRVADMRERRWYPTNLTLPNGEVLTVGGQIDSATNINQLHEVYQTDGTWRALTTAQRNLPLYPWLTIAPDGRVFVAGPAASTSFLDTSGTGRAFPGPTSNYGFRDYGSYVVYNEGKILIAGGGMPTNTAEVIDLNSANPTWRYTGPMTFPRRQSNLTMLPDGTVMVTGGSSSPGFNTGAGSVLTAEIWNPQTETWTVLPSHQERRLYHSTAFLLPDGRVAIAGGGQPVARDITDFDHKSVEIYSPPYLFRGARPLISAVTENLYYGEKIDIKTPRADKIAKVSLVGLSTVTHSMNQGQRFLNLPITRRKWETITAAIPSNRNNLPAGPYMLFILNNEGVPSEAKMIFVKEPQPQPKKRRTNEK